MKRGKSLAMAVCICFSMASALGWAQGGSAAAPFTCADLVGRTYRVLIPSQQFVCFEFVSADTVVETYATGDSFSVLYFIKGEKPGVCMILTQVSLQPHPSGSLEVRITDERVLGRMIIAVPGGFPPLPVFGQHVETGACEPGGPTSGSP
jgi:hypothetical protein